LNDAAYHTWVSARAELVVKEFAAGVGGGPDNPFGDLMLLCLRQDHDDAYRTETGLAPPPALQADVTMATKPLLARLYAASKQEANFEPAS
jgi:hypothetical protein